MKRPGQPNPLPFNCHDNLLNKGWIYLEEANKQAGGCLEKQKSPVKTEQTNKQTEQKVNIQTCASHGSILTDIVCREAWQTLDMPESSRFAKLSNLHQFWYRLWRQILHWNSLTSNRDRYEQYGPGCRHWKQQNSGRLKMKQ